MREVWYILFDGQSEDGRGPAAFKRRTTSEEVAFDFFVKLQKNPFSTGFVRVYTDTKEIKLSSSEDLNKWPRWRKKFEALRRRGGLI